jgi:hypothetical protein
MSPAIARYAALFNARDWEGVDVAHIVALDARLVGDVQLASSWFANGQDIGFGSLPDDLECVQFAAGLSKAASD